MASPSVLEVGAKFVHRFEQSGAMFQLMTIVAQDVQPIVEMLARLLEIAAPLEFLESAIASQFNDIISASVLNVQDFPHLQPIAEFTSGERDAATRA